MTDTPPCNRQTLFELFDQLGIQTRTHEHEAVFSVSESHKIKKDLPGGHTKSLFLKDKKGKLMLVICLNDTEVDLKSFHKKYDCGRVSFGNSELLWKHLGVRPGSVTPFALINDREDNRVNLVIDANMMQCDLLNFHPLENTATTAIARDDLLSFLNATGHEPSVLTLEKFEETPQSL